MTTKNKKNYSISFVRLLAFCLVVLCHIFYYFDNELAYWFNSGVQIFLIMSGFLYGQREKIVAKDFYKRNIPKILIDYYIFIALMIPIYLFVIHYSLDINDFLRLAFGIGTDIPGMGHLWYISTIMVCYLITPLIFKFFSSKINFIVFILIMGISEIVFAIIPFFTGAWINCYIIGFLLGNGYSKSNNQHKFNFRVLVINFPFMIFICGIEILVKYVFKYNFAGIKGRVINTVFHYGHISIAIMIFFGIIFLLSENRYINTELMNKLFNLSDKYSYDAYLVHLFMILGPYSFFHNRTNLIEIIVGVLLLVLYIFIASFTLRKLSGCVENLLNLKDKKIYK